MAPPKKDAIVQEPKAGELANLSDFADFAADGMEVNKDDLKTPFIKQLQSNSPEVAESQIEGAKPGMFLNTATSELIRMDGFYCLPIGKTHQFVEWVPREKGGGFVAGHAPDSDFVNKTFAYNNGAKFGKLTTPNGNELIESHDVFLVLLDETGYKPTGEVAIFSFTSTKIKAVKDWWTKMWTTKIPTADGKPLVGKDGKPIRPPFYSFRSRITGHKDPKTTKGVFFNVAAKPFVEGNWLHSIINPRVERELLETGRAFKELFDSGQVKADYENQKGPAEAGPAGGEQVPF